MSKFLSKNFDALFSARDDEHETDRRPPHLAESHRVELNAEAFCPGCVAERLGGPFSTPRRFVGGVPRITFRSRRLSPCCIVFKQGISQVEIDRIFAADKRNSLVGLRGSSFVANHVGDDGRMRFWPFEPNSGEPTPKPYSQRDYSGRAAPPRNNLSETSGWRWSNWPADERANRGFRSIGRSPPRQCEAPAKSRNPS